MFHILILGLRDLRVLFGSCSFVLLNLAWIKIMYSNLKKSLYSFESFNIHAARKVCPDIRFNVPRTCTCKSQIHIWKSLHVVLLQTLKNQTYQNRWRHEHAGAETKVSICSFCMAITKWELTDSAAVVMRVISYECVWFSVVLPDTQSHAHSKEKETRSRCVTFEMVLLW